MNISQQLSTTNDRAQTRIGVLCAGFFSVVLCTMVLTSCAKPLFKEDAERTVYDRYDLSRNAYEPQHVEDEFGRKQPNVKGRLAPKD